MCLCFVVFFSPFFLSLSLVVVKASPYLNYWHYSLSKLRFRVHYSAIGVFQTSVDSYPFVNLSCEGVLEKSLRLVRCLSPSWTVASCLNRGFSSCLLLCPLACSTNLPYGVRLVSPWYKDTHRFCISCT